MRAYCLFIMFSFSVALRLMTTNKIINMTGDMGGLIGATGTCLASTRPYATSTTTWVPLLEEAPAYLQTKLSLFGDSLYPMRDVRSGAIIANTSLFAPKAILSPLTGDSTHWTGLGGSNCNNWGTGTSTISGGKGANALGDTFLTSGTAVCTTQQPIICVEVPLTRNLAPPVYMFVTSAKYTANLGGILAADAICASRAAASTTISAIRQSGGRWFALLGENGTSVATRITSTVNSHTIYLPGTTVPGVSYETLLHLATEPTFADSSLYAYSEKGAVITTASTYYVWTGGTSTGGSATTNCQNWRSTTGSGFVGNAKAIYNDVLYNTSQLCTLTAGLYCMQYFSPIINVSAVSFSNESRIRITASIYDDVAWYTLRCVFATTGYLTNQTVFWGATNTINTIVVSNFYNSYSSLPYPDGFIPITPQFDTVGLVIGQPIYITCAVRPSTTTYYPLTWLQNVGIYTILDKPVIGNMLPFTSSVTATVYTNQSMPMKLRCVGTSIPFLFGTETLWSMPLGSSSTEVTTSANGSDSYYLTITNLTYQTVFITCAQYPIGKDYTASTDMASATVVTLPRCANLNTCISPSVCIDSLDGTLYHCSPFIDGGMRLSTAASLPCRSVSPTNTSSSVITQKTDGGDSISFCVNVGVRNDINALPYQMTFYYGFPNSPARFFCSNASFVPIDNNTMTASCLTDVGMGGSLLMAIKFESVYVTGNDTLSYPRPIIYNNSLRLPDVPNATEGAASVLAPNACQVVVAFDVNNVQVQPELQVYYGPSQLPLLYQCLLDPRTSTSTIYCSTNPATEFSISGFTFTVLASNQAVRGKDVLNLPAGRPVINFLNATQCIQNDDGIAECPTAGDTLSLPVIVNISGTNFGSASSFFRIFVDGDTCTLVDRGQGDPYDFATCRLPEGTGYGQSMFVQTDVFFSAPRSLVSYASPVVTRVCGCDVTDCANTDVTAVSGCDRGGSQLLDVFGANFGRAGATVLVGVDQCTSVVHDPQSPHSHLTCLLPPGSGLFRSVLVIQGNGAASLASSVSVSYTQCGFGTYQANTMTACQNCSAGKFSSIEGLSSCSDCPPGRGMADPGATVCDECQPGWFQPSAAQSGCIECDPGSFSAITSRTVCDDCAAGRFVNVSGSSVCYDCLPGNYQPVVSQVDCLPCALGKFQSISGQSACISCAKGEYADSVGEVSCGPCQPGSFQSDAGGSRCDYCVPGRFASLQGTSDCIPCQPGSISTSSGVVVCTLCPKGTAQASAGQSFCSDCTTGRFSAAAGLSSCDLCALGSITPTPAAQVCVPCPPGSTPADSVCACNPNYEWTGSTCELCVVGQDCSKFGVLQTEAIPLQGFLRVGNQSVSFQSCLVSTYCPGGAVRCAPYREGALCQLCYPGYREDAGAPDGSCSLCPAEGVSSGNIIGVGILLIFVLVFLYYIVVRGGLSSLDNTPAAARKKWWDSMSVSEASSDEASSGAEAVELEPVKVTPSKEDRVEKTLAYQMKIVITFVQLSTSVIALSTLSLPPTFRTFLSGFDFVNLNFIPWNYVGCISDYTLLTKILVTSIAPFVLLPVGGFILFLVLKILDRGDTSDYNNRRDVRAKYRAIFWKVTLFTVFLAYPAVSRQIFSYFRCVEVLQDQQPSIYLLSESFKEACYDDTWYRNLGVIVFLLLVYPFGVPLVLGLILRYYRPRFRERYVRYSLGFSFEGFVSEIWYFELLDMIHKLFVASIVSLLPSSSQVPVAMAILGVYLSLLIFAQPYVRKADNQLHMTSQVALYLIVFSFLARDAVGPISVGSQEDVLLSCLLITIFVSVVVHYVFRMIQYCRLAYLARRRKSRRKREIGLSSSVDGLHNLGADAPASNTELSESLKLSKQKNNSSNQHNMEESTTDIQE